MHEDEAPSRKETWGKRQLTRQKAPARSVKRRGNPPTKRGECLQVARPCPFVACRHHLFLHETDAGSVSFPYGSDVQNLARIEETCSLDVAFDGGRSLEDCAQLLNLTRERVRQIEERALQRLQAIMQARGIEYDTSILVERADDMCRSEATLENTAPSVREDNSWHSDLLRQILNTETQSP